MTALTALGFQAIDNQRLASAVKAVQCKYFDCIFNLTAPTSFIKTGKMLKWCIFQCS